MYEIKLLPIRSVVGGGLFVASISSLKLRDLHICDAGQGRAYCDVVLEN